MIKTSFLILTLFAVGAMIYLVYRVGIGERPRVGREEVRVGETLFHAEIADTFISRAQGLSGRESLGEDEAMLFIFSMPGIHSFWMKDMHFPLDIIWIKDGKVVGVSEGAEPEGVFPQKAYAPSLSIDMVLEINAGLAEKRGIKIGDAVSIKNASFENEAMVY